VPSQTTTTTTTTTTIPDTVGVCPSQEEALGQ